MNKFSTNYTEPSIIMDANGGKIRPDIAIPVFMVLANVLYNANLNQNANVNANVNGNVNFNGNANGNVNVNS